MSNIITYLAGFKKKFKKETRKKSCLLVGKKSDIIVKLTLYSADDNFVMLDI